MKDKVKNIFLFSFIFLSACSLNVTSAHNKAVNSGYEKLPMAKSLRDKFWAVSFITHFNMPTRDYKFNEKKWNTVTFIYGRYEVQYVQKVKLGLLDRKVIDSIGDEILYINEIKKIFLQDGSTVTRFGGLQKTL